MTHEVLVENVNNTKEGNIYVTPPPQHSLYPTEPCIWIEHSLYRIFSDVLIYSVLEVYDGLPPDAGVDAVVGEGVHQYGVEPRLHLDR